MRGIAGNCGKGILDIKCLQGLLRELEISNESNFNSSNVQANAYNNYVCRQGDDGSVGPVGPVGDTRMHEAISHTCLSSSAEYELALILKELRWITDQVSKKSNKNKSNKQ